MGKVQPPPLKTQQPPETNDEPVKIIVGKTLRQLSGDRSKDVFIHFYDPKNEECQKIEPKWTKLALKLAD